METTAAEKPKINSSTCNTVRSLCTEFLTSLILDDAVTYGPLTVFPVFGPVASGPDYLVMQEAIDRGLLEITASDDIYSVPETIAINKSTSSVLIIDGEQLIGANQDRVINTTIMLAPESKTSIPVSCTEQGRCNYTSSHFASADYVMPPEMRKKKMQSVSKSLKSAVCYYADQNEIWEEVAQLNRKANASSATGALKDGFDTKKGELDEYVNAFPVQPDQVGILAFLNDDIAGFEIIAQAGQYSRLHSKIIRSYAMDAVVSRNKQPADPVKAEEIARNFLVQVMECPSECYPSTGSGTDCRFTGKVVIGSGLIIEDTLVYLAYFTRDTDMKVRDEGRRTRYRKRREQAEQFRSFN